MRLAVDEDLLTLQDIERAVQGQQGTAGGGCTGLAHLSAQPRLGRIRRTLRRDRIGVARRDELDDAFARLFAADGPALLCVQQDAQLR